MGRFIPTRNGAEINIDHILVIHRKGHRRYALVTQDGTSFDYEGDLKAFDENVVVPAAPGAYVIVVYIPPPKIAARHSPDDDDGKPFWWKETVIAWSMTRTGDGYYDWVEPVLPMHRGEPHWHFLYPTADGTFYSPEMECRFETVEEGMEAVIRYNMPITEAAEPDVAD